MAKKQGSNHSRYKTLLTSAAIGMILTNISMQEVQAEEAAYPDEAVIDVRAESTEFVEEVTSDINVDAVVQETNQEVPVNVSAQVTEESEESSEIQTMALNEESISAPISDITEKTSVKSLSTHAHEEVVYFEDENLANLVKNELGLKSDENITVSALEKLWILDLYDTPQTISSLKGLEGAKNLWRLTIENNNISDITPLADLQSLIHLYLRGNKITDVTSLSNLSSLSTLYISDNNIADISALSNLSLIKSLALADNNITDISVLASMSLLEDLDLSNNNISDISPLKNSKDISSLNLSSNNITSIEVFRDFSWLQYVNLSNNNINDINPLKNSRLISDLNLSYNNIIDIEVLLEFPFVSPVNLEGNNITNMEIIYELANDYRDVSYDEARTEILAFETKYVNNPNIPAGTEEVSQEGVDGVRTIVERVTLDSGDEIKREVISNKITLDPVNQIIQVGTKAKEDDKNDGSKKDEDDQEKLVTAKVERHEGADREAVAIDVAEKHFSEAKKVIIVNQDKFPDAISATNISQGNFPVLYTRAAKLGKATLDFIDSLKSLEGIYLLGGKTSISQAVENSLIAKFGSIITRVDGATRFDANANAIRENYKKADHIIIATGETYTDALYGVTYADRLGAPIILSKTDRLVEASLALMKDLGVTQATIIGGVNSVTKDVEAQLKALGITINPRIAGETRYDGSVQVANKSYAQPDTLLIASGDTFTDALVSAPLAQKLDAPILLVRKDSMEKEVKAYLESQAGSIKTIYIQGGPHTISKANEAAIIKAVQPAQSQKKSAAKSKAHLSRTKEVVMNFEPTTKLHSLMSRKEAAQKDSTPQAESILSKLVYREEIL